jgi:RNA polymerase sigma factor (sigma-70 family)
MNQGFVGETATMATGQIDTSRPWLAAGPSMAARNDAELLHRFLDCGDEAAFATIVERHGRMVLGVCRQLLNDRQEADDAFQATFLVLVHKGRSIKKASSLAHWLHGVARRIALKANGHAARRRRYERQGVDMTMAVSLVDETSRELRPVLHEEVDRLPEKYRAPVVLCYLEGQTHEAAAARLQWPLGTVKGRLTRARELLRSRLVRRGVALSAAAMIGLLSQEASAAVSDELKKAALSAALHARRGTTIAGAALSPKVQALAAAVLAPAAGGMLKLAAAWLFAIGAVAASAGAVYHTVFTPLDSISPVAGADHCTTTTGVVERGR